MIRSYRDKETERIALGIRVKKFEAIDLIARRKLRILDAADNIEALAATPGNRLESLKGDRKGQYSIRINDQYRLCFVWKEGSAYEVEITDYH